VSGNYRPRRRYRAPGNAKGPAGAPSAGTAPAGTAPAGTGSAGPVTAGAVAGGPATGRRDTARRGRPPRGADPRRIAYEVLAAVRDRAAYANLLLPKLLAERQLAGRDAAFATELAYGTLRGQGTYDAVLSACSDRPLGKLDPPVLDALRLGTHQLLSTRVGAHAAVATSVDLARSVAGPKVAGYVNAVLRRVSTRDLAAWLDIVAPDPATDPDGSLAVRYSHPRWIVAAYRSALGDAASRPFTTPDATAPDAPDAPASQAAASQAAAPDATASGAAPDATAPDATVSGAAPDAGAEEPQAEAPPGEPDPSGAASGQKTPGQETPGQETPGQETPGQETPGQETPGQETPGQETPGQETPGGPPLTELAAALAAGNARPRVTLATLPAGPPRAELMPAGAQPGRWSPYAFTLASGDPAPLVESGAAAVQDEGSQLAAIALASAPLAGRPGGDPERWLDMCAGPGGKARLLYGLAAERGARLTAAELHPHRAALVEEVLTRAGRSMTVTPPAFEVLVADSTRPPWPGAAFDRVLLDVPCSGLGALRRRPEARWRKSEADLKELTALQRDLLRSALAAVRPGGLVAYVTCSPVSAETTQVVTGVAAAVPGTEFIDAPALLPAVPAVASADPRFAQLWPHRHGTDAIFIALLRRTV
jgi:16S rRNA (cytosine967-C5)-methyltransferase